MIMQSTNAKTMLQYCSVCKQHFEMEVVEQGTTDNVIWLKCPGCQGFLPRTEEEEETAQISKTVEEQPGEIALEDLDIESAKEYSEADEYVIGDVIHHRSWNDFGKVISKEQLPGNRKTIWAYFIRQGKVQLLEGVK
jgi:hypothetical protein